MKQGWKLIQGGADKKTARVKELETKIDQMDQDYLKQLKSVAVEVDSQIEWAMKQNLDEIEPYGV